MEGLKKTQMKFMIASSLLIYPEQPWLACNLATMVLGLCLASFFIFVGAVSLYYARNDLLAFVEIAHGYSIVVAMWVLTTNHYMNTMPSIHGILQIIDADIFKYETVCGSEEDEKTRNSFKEFFGSVCQRMIHYGLATGTVILCLAPVLISIYGSEDRKKIKELNYDLPVPFWIPFNTKTTQGFIVAYLLVCSQIFLIALYLSAAVPFLLYSVLEINLQYDILKRSILNVESRAIERYGWVRGLDNLKPEMLENDPLYEKCVHECLKENILHHTEIMRYFNHYQNLTSTIYGVVLGLSLIILASLSLVLTKTKLFSFETVKFAFFFVFELIIVAGYCFLGTYITMASEKIPNAVYNCPWFNLSTSQKKTLLIFQIRTKKSTVLKGNGLFEINLQLFVQILRTTYSIFNIFTSMEK